MYGRVERAAMPACFLTVLLVFAVTLLPSKAPSRRPEAAEHDSSAAMQLGLSAVETGIDTLTGMLRAKTESSHRRITPSMVESIRKSTMNKLRRSSFWVWFGLALMLGTAISPVIARAADPPIVGDWEGILNPGAQPKKKIIVHIVAAQDGSLSGTIDYPDQEVSGTPISAITYRAPTLHFESSPSLAMYDGTMNKDNSELRGSWTQGGAPVNLTLKKTP
jgi:hypothetical protein